MRVEFATDELLQCFQSYSAATRRWGPDVGRKYILRVNLLLAARTLQDLSAPRSLHLHPLKGARMGQYAININDRWRLIFTYNRDEGAVRIEEVSNHYDD